MLSRFARSLLCSLLLLPAATAWAAEPAKADEGVVRLIVPFAPGGASDVLARVLGQYLPDGKRIVVENRPGAGGNIAMGVAAKAAPDGKTMSIVSSTLTINPSLYRKVPYDPVKDFAAVSYVARVPTLLVVHPSVPARNVKELVDLLKANPDKFSYASSGNGTSQHLAGELLARRTGARIGHIPFNGAGPATTAVLGGHVPVAFLGLPSVRPHLATGALRVIAVTTRTRSQTLPDVPTLDESGYPGFDVDFWQGVVMPAGTPAALVASLSEDIRKTLQIPDVRKRLDQLGFEPVGSTPEAFAAQIRDESAAWGTFVKEVGVSLD
jgi:tripartite-type tricarboxylate transporter receptor subunit TctC